DMCCHPACMNHFNC
uniref:Alpha-conotoxin MilIA n=1 Tax=Conus milneedwardsi TaxID=2825866 RepID=CA1A_CONMD|nr:RecName: Full=Alpha-conotoxin MilIA [Conus milneedwardsi]